MKNFNFKVTKEMCISAIMHNPKSILGIENPTKK